MRVERAHILVGNYADDVAHVQRDRIEQRTDVRCRFNNHVQLPWVSGCLRVNINYLHGVNAIAVDYRAVHRGKRSCCRDGRAFMRAGRRRQYQQHNRGREQQSFHPAPVFSLLKYRQTNKYRIINYKLLSPNNISWRE